MNTTVGPTAVFFALAREASPFLRLCRDTSDIVVAVTGIGQERARRQAQQLFSKPIRPRVVIMAGYAGALDPSLAVGDIVIASEVADDAGNLWPTSWPNDRNGRILTVDRLIGTPSEKHELRQSHRATAVDMESAAVAEVCGQHGTAFGCVRAVSDDTSTSLSPRLLRLFAGGDVSTARVFLQMLRSPRLLPELIRLGRNTKLAGKELARTLWRLAGSG
jgi:adenosylhomocysteine nucleosidase